MVPIDVGSRPPAAGPADLVTTFHLLRHADKASPADVLSGRAEGVHLSGLGRRQAAEVARRLTAEGVDRIVSSPRERARETAAALAAERGLPVAVSADLDEIDYGQWTGSSVEALAPDPDWQRFHRFRAGTRIPGGESLPEVQARIVGAMLRLHREHPSEAVVLVSHGDPIKLAIAYFAGIPLELFGRLEIDPASVSTVLLGPDGARILRLNVGVPRPGG